MQETQVLQKHINKLKSAGYEAGDDDVFVTFVHKETGQIRLALDMPEELRDAALYIENYIINKRV